MDLFEIESRYRTFALNAKQTLELGGHRSLQCLYAPKIFKLKAIRNVHLAKKIIITHPFIA